MAFFGKIKETVSDTSKMVAQKAKDVAEITKLNNQISSEEVKIKDAYFAIGKRYFEETIGEVSDAYINDFTIINEAKAHISELKEQIKTIKGIYACPNCGAEVAIDAAFCSSCGAKMEPPILKEEKSVVETEEETTEKKSDATKTETNKEEDSAAFGTASSDETYQK